MSRKTTHHFMQLHNLAQSKCWELALVAYPANSAANEDWMAELKVNAQVFKAGPTARKREAVDAAALIALRTLGFAEPQRTDVED
ncbi:hypothetical protein FRC00_009870 [Tulasnella sp. 408]|nr:hypothetical protein FRC00_009870 [Tulasnella sp. 408]